MTTNHFLKPLLAQIKNFAAISDQEGLFPGREFELLKTAGVLQMPLVKDPMRFEPYQTPRLLEILRMIGSASLPAGRIYEGHVNALHLIDLYGKQEQRNFYFDEVFRNQSLFGVWNTQAEDGVKIHEIGSGQYRLEGSKTFCSGANWIQRPLITGELTSKNAKGWQMCIIPTEKMKEAKVDSSFWKPLGMVASVSYKLDFTGIVLNQADLIGPVNAYYQQPHFSAGAIRFAAVQLGAAQSILEETHYFLKKNHRGDDPFQKARVAEIASLAETGNLWISRAAALTDAYTWSAVHNAQLMAYANMTRTVINDICLKIMQLSERSVGVRALMRPHPLERIHRDLTTYLRQPGPDAALAAVGGYVMEQEDLSGLW